jgi:hypothetical protein
MWPFGILGGPVVHPIVRELPIHEVPMGDTMDFEGDIGRKPISVYGHPMPDFSFTHVALLRVAVP